jgi:cell wall-associated NlpC family hydrolase
MAIVTAIITATSCLAANGAVVGDLDRFPQSADTYLPVAPDSLIVSLAEQGVYADEFMANYFAPWRNEDLSYLDISLDKIATWHKNLAKKKYYNAKGVALPNDSMTNILANGTIKTDASPRPGVCLSDADVRVLPTETRVFSSAAAAKGDRGLLKLDQLQNSTIKPGEPLAIFAHSKDDKWLFAATGAVLGWIKAEKAALVDEDFMEKYMYASYAVFVKDNVGISEKNGTVTATAKMGTILPIEGADLLMPAVGKNGMASAVPYRPKAGEVDLFPVVFTPRNAARAMDELIGEPYGWGGAGGLRDCSAMTRDYFSLFGVWLPRNSADQAASGAVVSLENTPVGERPRTIVENGVPFATLIHMPGHIMLYLGVYDGEPVVFHNTWGVRVTDGGNAGRLVIGKAVISSLRAGEEIKNRPKSSLYIDNVDKLAFPIGGIGNRLGLAR